MSTSSISDYQVFVENLWKETTLDNTPHCDMLVLHKREQCTYCAMEKYDVLHWWRDENNVNHTGEYDSSKLPCPAQQRRSIQDIHRWYGNRPTSYFPTPATGPKSEEKP